MALTSQSMSNEPKPNENDPRGEIRYDEKGVGYWYSFKKTKKVTKKIKEESE